LLSVCNCLLFVDVGADYRHGIRLATSVDDKVLITLNARSENDRTKFVEDLKEAILEVGQRLPVLPISFFWFSRLFRSWFTSVGLRAEAARSASPSDSGSRTAWVVSIFPWGGHLGW